MSVNDQSAGSRTLCMTPPDHGPRIDSHALHAI